MVRRRPTPSCTTAPSCSPSVRRPSPSSRSAVTKEQLVARGVDAGRVIVAASAADVGAQLPTLLRAQAADRRPDAIATGDSYKDQVQNQWNENPVGSHHARESQPHTLEWFREVERHRYGVYAPWMPGTMEFAQHAGHDVLEIGGGLGTDLAQFAAAGADGHRSRSGGRPPAACRGEFPAQRSHRPLHSPRRGAPAVSRCVVRSRLQQRRSASHAEHRGGRH